MVLQQRLNYGFNGYQMPEVPRAARSARGRGPIRKKLEANKIHAFEILASVAGKLLQESEDPLPTNDCCGKDPLLGVDDTGKSKQQDEGNLLKEVPGEVRSFDKEETLLCGHGLQQRQQSYTLNGFSHSQENVSYEINSASKSLGHYCGSYSNKLVDSPLSNDFIEEKAQGVHKRKLETEPSKDESNRLLSSAENVLKMEGNPSVLVSSGHDVKTSFSGDCKNHGAFLCHCTKMKVGSRDDDENCAGYAQPHTMTEEFEHPPDVSDRRINNLVASRNWRVNSDVKVGGCSRNDGKLRQVYHNGRTCYSHQRSQKIYPFKKRKFLYRRPLTTSDREFENIFNSPDTRVNGDSCCAEIGPSSSTSQEVPLKSNDCNVKLSIKSFKVPELFIEIPATATVGSLKRTVMEAVTTIIGDGLHVGILVQGKKVRDDSKTLLQTGISHDDKRPNLGFILEPKRAKLTYPSCSEDPSLLSRHAVSLVSEPGTSNVSLNTPVTNTGGYVERDVKAVASVASSLTDKPPPASQAIVAVPPISVKPLTALPFHRKSGHAEYVQRRIRRPFSVSEVEALVQAVEILGTGRWRDVKLRAFESAKHRTYVDLKDKWKTLVHTARISPQQRRGEPVPQELLDRVLAAHAYWSQRHAKQLVKAVV